MPRVAVVLETGGSVGQAYHAGVLAALADVAGWDARRADVLVGTSAGAIAASMLRAGIAAADLARRATGRPLSPAGAAIVARSSLPAPSQRARPRRPTGRVGLSSPGALWRAVRAPWSVRPGSLAAAMLPAGQVRNDWMAAPLRSLFGTTWPPAGLWVTAVQLDTSRRVVFGKERTDVPVADAVRASCAIPTVFEPVEIDGHRYVDGGVHSPTNADVAAEPKPDLVIVSAPMSAVRASVRGGVEGPIRQFARLHLARELAGLRARQIPALVLQPTTADLEVMAGDALDWTKMPAVCERAFDTTRQRLRRKDVADRLAVLSGQRRAATG